MKKFLTILIIVLLPLNVIGQDSKQKNPLPLAKFADNVNSPLTAKERSQIIEVYGDYANKYIFSKPHRLKSMKHLLRNRIVIKLISDENNKKPCTKLSEVELNDGFVSNLKRDESFDPNSFNPLKYNFEFYSRAASIYQVDNTDYYIIIKSQYQ